MLCLLVLSSFLAGVFSSSGSGGRDPYHVHIVIGGTPSERTHALVLHLIRDRAGIEDALPPAPQPAVGGGQSARVYVLLVRGDDGFGPAIFSPDEIGALLAASVPPVPAPSRMSWVSVAQWLSVPQTAPFLPDPPPRTA
jgi:hypothetical protein